MTIRLDCHVALVKGGAESAGLRHDKVPWFWSDQLRFHIEHVTSRQHGGDDDSDA